MNAPSAPVRILVVEDSELDAELLLCELERDGLDVVSERVDNEPSFVAALARFAPDVVISDLSMPEFSGYRALELARASAPDTPFVFVSGTMGEEAAVQALRGGATDYVLKQNLARLAAAVRRALADAAERRARVRAEADLLRAQRYESLALLASGLSHDLRNVLQPIALGAHMLRSDPRDEIRRVGKMITECTQRGIEIIESMLSFARGSRASSHRVGVKSLLDGLELLLRGTLPRNVRLTTELTAPALEVDGNHTEFQQCLLNLCLNAIQAMPDGGVVTLKAEPVVLDETFFEAGETRAPGAYLRISVADTGVGMTDEIRARLFQPFFTTKQAGNGLGLVSCRRILDNHRSFIRVASAPGAGTTFSIYIPLPAARSDVVGGTVPQGRGERVLIVVERESKLALLQDIVESHGYRVSTAENGLMALTSIETEGLPDVVIMEAAMNLMTGVRTASALVERDFRGTVIMIARHADRTLGNDMPLHRIRFIDKPVDPDQLLAVLAEEVAAAHRAPDMKAAPGAQRSA